MEPMDQLHNKSYHFKSENPDVQKFLETFFNQHINNFYRGLCSEKQSFIAIELQQSLCGACMEEVVERFCPKMSNDPNRFEQDIYYYTKQLYFTKFFDKHLISSNVYGRPDLQECTNFFIRWYEALRGMDKEIFLFMFIDRMPVKTIAFYLSVSAKKIITSMYILVHAYCEAFRKIHTVKLPDEKLFAQYHEYFTGFNAYEADAKHLLSIESDDIFNHQIALRYGLFDHALIMQKLGDPYKDVLAP